MDGFNKPGKLFWKPPTKTEMASLGIVRSCASDGGQKFTWVFKGGSVEDKTLKDDWQKLHDQVVAIAGVLRRIKSLEQLEDGQIHFQASRPSVTSSPTTGH